eukprot:TRINITY_DN846_c0_g1_i1.p2 TRINITY_DN846_c0_g1~~TRINITY_DN846_c0_g1_i1.p2  ORF type:complete len:297 (+),score=92.08 TRINITY_DN846_c0_g1_i1:167-1057(+)
MEGGSIGSKVIMITGCNRGIGLGILKNLAERADNHTFIMAVRSVDNGKKAVEELEKTIPRLGERVTIRELDLSKPESIDAFATWAKDSGKKIDCLINNAGTATKGDTFNEEVVRTTFQTNFYGSVDITEKLLPSIADSGKIIFVGSMLGCLGRLASEELKQSFNNPKITREQLFKLAEKFHADVADGSYKEKGWIAQGYRMASLCQNIYVRILGRDSEVVKRGIQVVSCSPGWVRTDMAGPKAPRSIEQGVVCPCSAVYFPWKIDPKYQGQLLFNCKVANLDRDIEHDVTPPESPR